MNAQGGGGQQGGIRKLELASIVISLVALAVTLRGCHQQQEALDRASGKVAANFEFVGIGNSDEKRTDPITRKTSAGFEMITVRDPAELMLWNPTVEVKNSGPEIIDSVRVEVRFISGTILDLKGENKSPSPFVTNSISDIDLPLKVKMMPGQTAGVSIIKPLVLLMLQAQQNKHPDLEHMGHFQVRTFCKVVGAATPADRPTPYKHADMRFVWIPKGFTKESCKDILEMQPAATIGTK